MSTTRPDIPAAISDEVAGAAAELLLKSIGTSLRHYMPGSQIAAIEAMRGILTAERARSADIADQRAAICADACDKINAGTLYAGIPSAFATENCARLEAVHIGKLIRGEQPVSTLPEERVL